MGQQLWEPWWGEERPGCPGSRRGKGHLQGPQEERVREAPHGSWCGTQRRAGSVRRIPVQKGEVFLDLPENRDGGRRCRLWPGRILSRLGLLLMASVSPDSVAVSPGGWLGLGRQPLSCILVEASPPPLGGHFRACRWICPWRRRPCPSQETWGAWTGVSIASSSCIRARGSNLKR